MPGGKLRFMEKYLPLLFGIALIAAFSGCDAGGTRATVTGTLILPAAANFTYYVWVENDTYAAVAETSGVVAVASPTVDYSIDDVLYGAYYIHAVADYTDDGAAEHEQYYGGVTVNPPLAPNAEVPSSGTVVFDITFSN